MLAMAQYCDMDYEGAAMTFKKYRQSYPKGIYAEMASFYIGESLYMSTPEPRLDQTQTINAIAAFQEYMDIYPEARLKDKVQDRIFELQDKLVKKELYSAELYYNLGTYFGNCTSGGNNYEACIITAQNAINDYPYSTLREDFALLIMKSKFELAQQSVEAKKIDRYRDAEDECYGFINEYPDSKNKKLCRKIHSLVQEIHRRKQRQRIKQYKRNMDYKKSKAPTNTVTRNIMDLCEETGNIYESVAIIAKRANQISVEIKQDLSKKLAEFASYNDSLEEVFENREQIEISRYYEKLPKPTLLATQEFIDGNVYWRDTQRDNVKEA